MNHRTTLFVAFALVLAGCAENAILELQIELPAAPPDDGTGSSWYALTRVRRASDNPFDVGWTGPGATAIELGPEPQWDCISVQSFDQEMDLHVRVAFCRAENCLDLMDGSPPERWFRLEHPFYIGRRTYWSTQITEVPECASDGDCGGIGVCIDGSCGCELGSECPGGMICEAGNCLLAVDRCRIEGCIEGDSASYCAGSDGPHFCETNPNADRDGSYQCDLPAGP